MKMLHTWSPLLAVVTLAASVAAFSVAPSSPKVSVVSSSSSSVLFQSSVAIPTELNPLAPPDTVTEENPLRVVIAGAGVGGLTLANVLCQNPQRYHVTVLEQTAAFKRFGGPIQLASNAMQILSEMDAELYGKICEKFTTTGDKENGIKVRSSSQSTFSLQLRNLMFYAQQLIRSFPFMFHHVVEQQ
jgi:zeaxanthin epoxidase